MHRNAAKVSELERNFPNDNSASFSQNIRGNEIPSQTQLFPRLCAFPRVSRAKILQLQSKTSNQRFSKSAAQMKFRKATVSSPKMELLPRRSTSSKVSNFKRSKSFRASVKLMSKIRNQAHHRVTSSFELSPVSLDPKGLNQLMNNEDEARQRGKEREGKGMLETKLDEMSLKVCRGISYQD